MDEKSFISLPRQLCLIILSHLSLFRCVGIWENDRVEIIANDQGYRTTPSYVAFTNSEILIGDAAKNQITLNPCNTVFDAYHLIGRGFYDYDVQYGMKACSIQKKFVLEKLLLERVKKFFSIQILLY